jgi:hypothetical protein
MVHFRAHLEPGEVHSRSGSLKAANSRGSLDKLEDEPERPGAPAASDAGVVNDVLTKTAW